MLLQQTTSFTNSTVPTTKRNTLCWSEEGFCRGLTAHDDLVDGLQAAKGCSSDWHNTGSVQDHDTMMQTTLA